MTETFTLTDLIRFVYHETSETENRAIERALLCDNELLDKYIELKVMTENLDSANTEPSQSSVDAILSFSKSLPLPSVSN
ncbi:MAG: hypothetical protein WBB45_08695 [Cyclobacteriaceae bacterium]